jgi:hypothetical protein
MNIQDCYLYVTDRLNVLSTNSGDKIPKHTFVRTFNSAQSLWVADRYKLNGTNKLREDELQILLTLISFAPTKKDGYWQEDLVENYFHAERAIVKEPCQVFLVQKKEEEVNVLLSDDNWKPSLEWAESFYTIHDKKIKIYGDFPISLVDFYYYRTPLLVNMEDGFNDSNGQPNIDINPEFQNDSLIEILNLTVQILSGDSLNRDVNATSNNLNNRYT